MPQNINCSISFHGAAGCTTGSRHLLTIDDKQILLDCGLYQGRRAEAENRNASFPFPPRGVHAVILSHAHIDHSGNLPNLVKQGYGGSIHCTPATEDLCRLMLRDSAHIQEMDAQWINKRNAKRGRSELVVPLYTTADAEKALTQFSASSLNHPFSVHPDVEVNFFEAGHILGSAGMTLDLLRPNSGGRKYRLAFSGDIGRKGLPLLPDPVFPSNVDWLIMESTYGARTHDPIGDAKEELRQAVVRVAARGGKIIVPSFSVERTQEIVYFLMQLTDEGKLPPIPVFVDSPLAVNVTEVFRMHSECLDEEARRGIDEKHDPFGFDRLTYVRSVEESKKLNDLRGPCMIISASGMCEAGRILHHLKNNIEEPKNCVMFVGYQAENTLGRKIVERQPEVNIFGEPHRLRAEVVTLNSMSGHADKNDLFEYAKTVKANSPLKKVFLVHGEPDGLNALGDRLRQDLNLDVVIPSMGQRHFLEA